MTYGVLRVRYRQRPQRSVRHTGRVCCRGLGRSRDHTEQQVRDVEHGSRRRAGRTIQANEARSHSSHTLARTGGTSPCGAGGRGVRGASPAVGPLRRTSTSASRHDRRRGERRVRACPRPPTAALVVVQPITVRERPGACAGDLRALPARRAIADAVRAQHDRATCLHEHGARHSTVVKRNHPGPHEKVRSLPWRDSRLDHCARGRGPRDGPEGERAPELAPLSACRERSRLEKQLLGPVLITSPLKWGVRRTRRSGEDAPERSLFRSRLWMTGTTTRRAGTDP